MKKLTLMLVTIIISFCSISQTPQAFKYQAVVRDNAGEIIANQEVSFRISIRDVSTAGTIIYQETHSVTTNDFGLAILEVGNGDPPIIGNIADIDWGTNPKFLEVELDPANGSSYVSMGTTQLLAVPYSLYAESTGDTSRWKKNNDDLYYNNGSVGIGTDNPNSWAKLDVRGNFSVDGDAYINHLDATESVLDLFNTISDWELVAASDNNRFDIRKWGGVPALSISDNNFIGIGTTTPLAALHVEDRIRVGEDPTAPPVYGELYHEGGGSGFIINANAGGGGWADLYMQTNGITKMFIESNGNVGIGTTTPLSKLHIENVDISLQGSDIPNEHLTIESSDAGLGLYSSNGGGYGSVLCLGEVVSGTLNNKWSIFRTTSVYSGHENQLRFSYGTDPSYAVNPTVLTLDEGGSVGIGTNTPDESALLDLNSNSKGMLIPRMTQAEIAAITNPADGLQAYNIDDGKMYIYVFTDNKWKEVQYGTGEILPSASYTIGTGGSCANTTVNGNYYEGVPLAASNTVTLDATVTAIGTWSITTNTLNGYSFSGSGTFATTGTVQVTLDGIGTPATVQTDNFTATANAGGGTCTFSVTVAIVNYTIGTGGSCVNTTVNGNYYEGVALDGANTVSLDASVTSPGPWSITTNILNGYSFSGSGTFITTGTVQVTLYGSGTPITAQTDNFTVSASSGGGSCIFLVTVATIPSCPTIIIDIDGNTYNIVQIDYRCWMKENLKTTTYQNGTPIPNVTDPDEWGDLTSGAYVWYDNDISWKGPYGALYNWYAVDDPNGLCPTGWHVPSDDEWTILTDFIGGTSSPHGTKLKSCRQVNSPFGGGCITTEHPRWNEYWLYNGTDYYGFSGLPGGARSGNGTFYGIGGGGVWWSSTESSSSGAWSRILGCYDGDVTVGYYDKQYGFSVRCLRDN